MLAGEHNLCILISSLEKSRIHYILIDIDIDETTLTSNIPQSEELIIVPGEGKQLMSILNDQYRGEELAHLYLSPAGNFGYKVERNVKLSPVKYFNQRLLNYQ